MHGEGIKKCCTGGLKGSLNKGYGKSGCNVRATASGKFLVLSILANKALNACLNSWL